MEMPPLAEAEAGVHQVVGEITVSQAAQAEGGVNQLGDFFFLQGFVDVFKRQALRPDFRRRARPTVVS